MDVIINVLTVVGVVVAALAVAVALTAGIIWLAIKVSG